MTSQVNIIYEVIHMNNQIQTHTHTERMRFVLTVKNCFLMLNGNSINYIHLIHFNMMHVINECYTLFYFNYRLSLSL